MYYNAQRKLAFVMPPRTGSTMFSALLKLWNVPLIGNEHHAIPKSVHISEPHTIYGFFRNPLDWFLSLLRFMQKQSHKWANVQQAIKLSATEIKLLPYDDLIDAFPTYSTVIEQYFYPQTKWLENAQLLDFCNYHAEILRVARMLDVTQVHVGVMNDTNNSGVLPSQRVIDFVQSQYADDYRLGRERGLLT